MPADCPHHLPDWIEYRRYDGFGTVSVSDAHGNTTGFRLWDDATEEEVRNAIKDLAAFRAANPKGE